MCDMWSVNMFFILNFIFIPESWLCKENNPMSKSQPPSTALETKPSLPSKTYSQVILWSPVLMIVHHSLSTTTIGCFYNSIFHVTAPWSRFLISFPCEDERPAPKLLSWHQLSPKFHGHTYHLHYPSIKCWLISYSWIYKPSSDQQTSFSPDIFLIHPSIFYTLVWMESRLK